MVAPREAEKAYRKTRAVLIDSGANINTVNYRHVKDCLQKYLRVRDEDMGPVETAGGEVNAAKGIRMRISTWDVETDWTALKDGSSGCLSMGERCWENDYTFVWVMRRFPCFLFEGIIVILDVEGILPVWHPEYDSSGEMLGAFDFYQNAF